MSEGQEIRYENKWSDKFCLIMAALIWGSCLVAQKSGMDYIGAATFTCVRSYIAFFCMIPVVLILGRQKGEAGRTPAERETPEKKFLDRVTVKGGIVCGIACTAAMLVQQYGVAYTSVGKAGFITALYILIIPLMGMIWKIFPSIKVWISVVIAIIGLYLMCLGEGFGGINFGDVMMFFDAILLSIHFYCINHFVKKADPIKMSWLQFIVVGVICTPIMLLTEDVNIDALLDCAVPILYAGVCSNALGYTLQMIGQRTVEPTKACLLMSMESVFSLLAGLVVMGEILVAREYIGCVLMFVAIILSQLPEKNET